MGVGGERERDHTCFLMSQHVELPHWQLRILEKGEKRSFLNVKVAGSQRKRFPLPGLHFLLDRFSLPPLYYQL